MPNANPTKKFCFECIKVRRKLQNRKQYQKTKASNELARARELVNEGYEGKSEKKLAVPPEDMFRYEIMLLDKAKVSYGVLSLWKRERKDEYIEWAKQVSVIYLSSNSHAILPPLPDYIPESLRMYDRGPRW